MSVALKKLEEIISELPAESQAEVVDFAEFLREKLKKQNGNSPKKERLAGLHDGQGWISDDFNDEPGDEFRFGEDFGIIKKDDESAA